MTESKLEMKFDPQTINHLGLRMYSTLPPALAELISNSCDADAKNIIVTLAEENKQPKSITVEDDGDGMSYDEIRNKFLVIGRNRRSDDGDVPSKKFNRLPKGKKGLGKLALFGLAKTISVTTRQDGKLNEFVLDWDELMAAKGAYRPRAVRMNEKTKDPNGTLIKLTNLKRKSSFDISDIADSLSRIFIFDGTFNVILASPQGDRISIDGKRKYNQLNVEFSWDLKSTSLVSESSEYHGKLSGELHTTEKPIPPSSGLRGITLFSRGKLVNAPEFFSVSTSSHFYQYLTGWISADFIDLLSEDVISTNRQSIDWDHPDMEKLREFLSGIVSQVNIEWRKKRKDKKDEDLKKFTGIDTKRWMETMPSDVRENTSDILSALGGEDALEKFTPIVKALHEIVPEYPLLHWRHLHPTVQEKSKKYYEDKNYYTAFLEALKKYVDSVKTKSGMNPNTDELSVMPIAFKKDGGLLEVIGDYKKSTGAEFTQDTKDNIQHGQHFMSHGIYAGGRNPLSHEEVAELKVSDLFSEKDCLDMLSLLSHLFKRLDNAKKKAT